MTSMIRDDQKRLLFLRRQLRNLSESRVFGKRDVNPLVVKPDQHHIHRGAKESQEQGGVHPRYESFRNLERDLTELALQFC